MDIPESVRQITHNISRVLVGKGEATELALIALVCGGHVLIEDAPGLGKTTLALGLAQSLGCSLGRIQFTPDLLPSDITGFTMLDIQSGQRTLIPGGIMHQLVLADEINRASPKTQSALLEAMQENQVTVDGQTLQLPRPFMVLATQNPVELAGVYPLPEAQRDRFLLRIHLGYPSAEEEMDILSRHQSAAHEPLSAVLTEADVLALQAALDTVAVAEDIKGYIVQIAGASRAASDIELPVSPRGSIALMRAAMAAALLSGRDYVLPDDVQRMAVPVLAHRLSLTPAARAAGHRAETVLGTLLQSVPAPRIP